MIHPRAHSILFAEADLPFRAGIVSVLRNRGYRVVEAGDGREAWQCFRHDALGFHLVITEYKMPEFGGLPLIKAIKTEKPLLPIILCSSNDLVMDVFGKVQPDLFLQKPYTIERLLVAIGLFL